jgi:hypothetical protein
MEKIKIKSNEEYDAVINEIIERHRDIMLLNMVKSIKRKYTKKFLSDVLNKLQEGDTITLNYAITMVPADFLQILARIRRKKIKK